jgi:hypothetical protein
MGFRNRISKLITGEKGYEIGIGGSNDLAVVK